MAYQSVRVAFHAHDYSAECASNRLRLFKPMQALRDMGFVVGRHDPALAIENYDCIVLSRAFSKQALKVALAAKSAGRPVIVDMCDNLFALSDHFGFRGRCDRLRELIGIADIVTAPTAKMASQLQGHVPKANGRFRIVPDALEIMPGDTTDPQGLAGLDRFQRRHDGALHCAWYGSSAGQLSGFAHLDRALDALALFSKTHPVTLTVISDNRLRYWLARRNWRVPTHYLPFRSSNFAAALARHDVAIIPVGENGYTRGKSINRAATAVMAGLGVVADPLDSYEELRPWVALGDWQAGLARYAARPPASDPDLAAARQHLERRYGHAAVGMRWAHVIAEVTRARPGLAEPVFPLPARHAGELAGELADNPADAA